MYFLINIYVKDMIKKDKSQLQRKRELEREKVKMKNVFKTVCFCMMFLLIITGCSSKPVKQKVDELVIGNTYKVDDLFEKKDDNTKIKMEQEEITPDKIGEVESKISVDNEEYSYTFKCVDKTAPEVKQIKTDLVQNEKFDIKKFIEVKDDVDTEDKLIIDVDDSKLKTDTLGEYILTVSVKDSSSNQTESEITVNVVEPFTSVKIGDKLNPSWNGGEAEVKINDVSFMDEVNSTSDNMFKQYFPNKDGEKYFVIKMTITNLGGDNLSNYDLEPISEQTLNVKFDNKFNYHLQQLDSTSCVMSKFWSIQPLKSLDVYLFQSVPDEVTSKPYTAYFSVGGNKYKIEKN